MRREVGAAGDPDLVQSKGQEALLMDWMWHVRESGESRMIPRASSWATRRMEPPMRRREAGWQGEFWRTNEELSPHTLEMSISYPV